MDNVSQLKISNNVANCNIASIKPLSLRYNVYLGLITVLLMIIGFGSGIVGPFAENAVAQTTGICDRTPEVADAIVAEIQSTRPEASCADITEDELGSIEGPISIKPSALKAGDFAALTTLTELKIAGSGLILLRAGTFTGLDNLETLEVQSPSLSTIHSGAFSGLPKIKTLHLQGNNIRAVPRDIFHGLGTLEALSLYGNRIGSLPIGIFSGLEQLRTLDLHTGGVKNLSHGILTGMPNLRALHFRNEATGVLESGAFIDLGNLQWLYLEGSGITKMASGAFAGLHNLRRLYLNDNQIVSLPPGVFRYLKNITHLHLHGNALETLPSGTFNGLDQLRELFLHDNNIKRLPADIFQGLDSLETIHLDRNQLTEVPNELVKGLTNLKDLTFFHNQLSDVRGFDLSDQVNLRNIDFEGNMRAGMPEDLFVSPPCSLRVVGIDGNESGELPSATIDGVEYEILDVLPQPSTQGCKPDDGITDLWVDGISLASDDLAKIRDDFSKLEWISMPETGATSEAVIDFLANRSSTALDGIDLSSNDLSAWNSVDRNAVLEAIKKNENLVTLRLSHIGINGDTAIAILENAEPSLRRVDFSENDLSGWNDPEVQDQLGAAFSRLPKSEWWFVELDDTSIDSTAAGTILTNVARTSGERNFVRIELSNNEVTEIDASWFEEWKVLSDLHLSNNQITTFDPAVLGQFADGFRYLYLDGNPLDPIPSIEEFEAVLPNLIELELPIPEEPVEMEEVVQLPRTGGGSMTVNNALLILGIGLTMLAATGVLLSIRSRRNRGIPA